MSTISSVIHGGGATVKLLLDISLRAMIQGTLERNPLVEDITISFVNEEEMPRYAVWLLARTLGARGEDLRGATIALLGLADTDSEDVENIEENPVLEIRDELLKEGAIVVSEDSYSPEYVSADATIVATDPSTFRIEV